MNINRDNYEEIFMLYADNELTAEERTAVEIFVEQNTDLASELNLLKQLQFKPDADLVFMDKALGIRRSQGLRRRASTVCGRRTPSSAWASRPTLSSRA